MHTLLYPKPQLGSGLWVMGPVALNGVSGGSENYYKKTADPADWSGAPIALPLGKTGLNRISAANNALFFHYNSGVSTVSFDRGDNWTLCNIALNDDNNVFWNGSRYVCREFISTDGITWTAMVGLSRTPDYAVARPSDGAIVVGNNLDPNPYIEKSLDNGVTWATVTFTGFEGFYGMAPTSRTERIAFIIGAPTTGSILGYYTDDLFATIQADGGSYAGRYYTSSGCSLMMQSTFSAGVAVSFDGLYSFLDTSIVAPATTSPFFDFGDGKWVVDRRTAVGAPSTHEINISTDGGRTFTANPQLEYGPILNIARIGGDGSCAAVPQVVPTLTTENVIYSGPQSALEFSSLRAANFGGSELVYSNNGDYYVISGANPADFIIYKRNTVNGGYDRLPNPATMPLRGVAGSCWSFDDAYLLCTYGTATAGEKAILYSRSGDTFTAVPLPNTAAISQTYAGSWNASPSGYRFIMSTPNVGQILLEIVGGVEQPLIVLNGPSFGMASNTYSFSPDGAYIAITGSNGFRIYSNIAAPAFIVQGGLGAGMGAGFFWGPGSDYVYCLAANTNRLSRYSFNGVTLGAAEYLLSNTITGTSGMAVTPDMRYLAIGYTAGSNAPLNSKLSLHRINNGSAAIDDLGWVTSTVNQQLYPAWTNAT